MRQTDLNKTFRKGDTMNATFTTKDHNHTDETTIYWFDISGSSDRVDEGSQYGVSDCNGEQTIVDCDGCPVPPEYALELKNVLIITDEMIND